MALIALGVSGGIGAYKAVEIARGLQKQGHDVAAIMTRAARRFVGPLTFEAITRREVLVDQWKRRQCRYRHISVASSAALPRGAGDGHIIGVRQRHRGRFDVAASGYASPGTGAGDERQRVQSPAVKRNPTRWPLARDVRRTREGYLACGWIGAPARRARGRSGRRPPALTPARSLIVRACWSPRARPTRISIRRATRHRSAVAWDTRLRRKRRGAARR